MHNFYDFLKHINENENPYKGAIYASLKQDFIASVDDVLTNNYGRVGYPLSLSYDPFDYFVHSYTDFPKFYNYTMIKIFNATDKTVEGFLKKELNFVNSYNPSDQISGKIGDKVYAKMFFHENYENAKGYIFHDRGHSSHRVNMSIAGILDTIIIQPAEYSYSKSYNLFHDIKKPCGDFLFPKLSVHEEPIEPSEHMYTFKPELDRMQQNMGKELINFDKFCEELVEFLNESIPSLMIDDISQIILQHIEYFLDEKLKPAADEYEKWMETK